MDQANIVIWVLTGIIILSAILHLYQAYEHNRLQKHAVTTFVAGRTIMSAWKRSDPQGAAAFIKLMDEEFPEDHDGD